MKFFTTDLDGVTLIEPDLQARLRILESVKVSEADYPEVYLSNASGLVLGYRAGGILIREENREVVASLQNVSVEDAAKAWEFLASGDVSALDSLPWQKV